MSVRPRDEVRLAEKTSGLQGTIVRSGGGDQWPPGGLAPLGYLRKTFNFIRDEPLKSEGLHFTLTPKYAALSPPRGKKKKKNKGIRVPLTMAPRGQDDRCIIRYL